MSIYECDGCGAIARTPAEKARYSGAHPHLLRCPGCRPPLQFGSSQKPAHAVAPGA